MKRLTVKEEEIMGWFWQKGPLFVKELLEYYEEPKPVRDDSDKKLLKPIATHSA